MDHYRSQNWQEFRREIIESDGNVCVRCGRGTSEGAILQVHHKEYIAGRKLWEYPHGLCETLCKGCHAQEHGKIAPQSGWELAGEDDLGGLDGSCDFCGENIRYVFLIFHQKWLAMEVGSHCCDRLTSTDEASSRTHKLKLKNRRRDNFLRSGKWAAKEDGSWIKRCGAHLGIAREKTKFRIYVNQRRGNLEFNSEIEAKIKVFDLIENGEMIRYLAHHKAD